MLKYKFVEKLCCGSNKREGRAATECLIQFICLINPLAGESRAKERTVEFELEGNKRNGNKKDFFIFAKGEVDTLLLAQFHAIIIVRLFLFPG